MPAAALSTAVPPGTSAPTTPTVAASDPIPVENRSADRGCLDHAGTLHAAVDSWYRRGAGSLSLNGDRGTSAKLDAFQHTAVAAVEEIAPRFDEVDGVEFRPFGGGCVTHRYASFVKGDEQIVVAAWRVVSAADPFWVPNEAAFVRVDDATTVSRGEHIAVVLAVASDGTTARVTAYGARAAAAVSGWPTTAPPPPSGRILGRAAVSVDELTPVAQTMLAFVLDNR